MSWLPLKITKEALAKQEAELRANRGNVTFVDESKIDVDESRNISRWRKKEDLQ